jgi:4-amino-4-deoxy-L-arabinose transferase-like glycosyltransferase
VKSDSAFAMPRKHTFWTHLAPALIPFLILFITGMRGINFGNHWDEIPYQLHPVRQMYESGTFLPQYYVYPGLSYIVGAITVIPSFFEQKLTGVKGIKGRVFESIESQAFLLRLRAVFLFITCLSTFWVYLTVWVWRKSKLQAWIASAWFSFSWEIAYHARWVATDGLLMQFGALTLLFCTLALKSKKSQTARWRWGAAVSAGLGFGTKYPGALLFIPVLLTIWFTRGEAPSILKFAKQSFRAFTVFIVAYLLTTPGTLLQPILWWYWVKWVMGAYAHGWEFGNAIQPGFQHLLRMLVYLSMVAFSHFTAIAIVATILVGIGIFATGSSSIPFAAVLFLFPVIYIGYFSRQGIMNVRNLLVIFPFLSVLISEGFYWLKCRSIKKPARFALLGAMAICLGGNAGWLIYAGESIRAPDRNALVDGMAYVKNHETSKFLVSAKLLNNMTSTAALPNVVGRAEQADYFIFFKNEIPHPEKWPANRFHQFKTWFSPYEVNLDYYATWAGHDHIVVVKLPVNDAQINLFLISSASRVR